MIDLKPCPFCGSKDIYMPYIGGIYYGNSVYCRNCGTFAEFGNDNQLMTEEEIAKAWNTRAGDTK